MKDIKGIYESKINKEDIYNKVIDKIEKRNEKYMISIVILIIVGIIIGIGIVDKNDYRIYVRSQNVMDTEVVLKDINPTDEVVEANGVSDKNYTVNDKKIKVKEDILKILGIIMEGEDDD